jgi:hypothetical protein
MTRTELEHIIRAARTIADVEDLVVIVSQAMLGEFCGAPAELLVSNEADIFPFHSPKRSDLIDSTGLTVSESVRLLCAPSRRGSGATG